MYRNNGNSYKWLKVKCIGTLSNRSAIGAKVHIEATIGGKEMWQMREISDGSGHGQSSLTAHFGLRDAKSVTLLRIEWPSGITQEYTDLAANLTYEIYEPPLITSTTHWPNGYFELVLLSRGNFDYDIQASTDFYDWTTIGSLKKVNGPVQFVDAEAQKQNRRFYRAVMVPSSTILGGPILNTANGHVYYLLAQNDWTTSEAQAVALGGHLVTIDDQAENEWVFSTFGNYGGVNRALWIGLTDREQEGTFVWTSGQALGYTHWQSPPQPDNGAGGSAEHYVHMFPPSLSAAGIWNDFQNLPSVLGFPLHGVVEMSP